jgi:hypothetical protein
MSSRNFWDCTRRLLGFRPVPDDTSLYSKHSKTRSSTTSVQSLKVKLSNVHGWARHIARPSVATLVLVSSTGTDQASLVEQKKATPPQVNNSVPYSNKRPFRTEPRGDGRNAAGTRCSFAAPRRSCRGVDTNPVTHPGCRSPGGESPRYVEGIGVGDGAIPLHPRAWERRDHDSRAEETSRQVDGQLTVYQF